MITLSWDKKSERFWRDLPARFKRGIASSLPKIGAIGRTSAKKQFGGSRQLKVRSGTLRTSIVSGVETKGGKEYAYVGTDVIYGPTHEYGDYRRNIQVRPYLEPGVRVSLAKMIRVIESEIVKEVEK